MINEADVIFPKIKEHIRFLYGGEASKDGPFCYRSYLWYMIQKNSWGDQGMILGASVTYNVLITVVLGNTDPVSELRIRHSRPLSEVDVVIVYDGVGHYSAVGKSLHNVTYRAVNALYRKVSIL
jgi:hypothetical protein